VIRPRSGLPPAWSSFGAATAIGVTATIVLIASGVTLKQIAAMAGYEAAFVLLPGYAAYRLLFAEDAQLSRQLTFAWGLGYAIEMLAFTLTAAVNMRRLFLGLPALALLILAIAGRTRRPARTKTWQPVGAGIAWTFAAVSSLSLVYLWATYFLDNPLPGTVPVVSYYVDTVHALALSAEALHHWPMMDPHVHGEGFGYYLFPFMHMAAISQVTGLDLPVVIFRLFVVPLFIAVVVQSYYLGTVAGHGSRLAGIVAAACVMLIGELDLSVANMYPFSNSFFFGLIYSPSFLMGLVVFIPFAAAVATIDQQQCTFGRFVALVLLLIACAGTKGQVVPVLVAALAGFVAWIALRERRLHTPALLLTVVTGALLLGLYSFAQQRATSIAVHPFARTPTATTLPVPIPWILGLSGLLGIRMLGLFGAIPAAWRVTSRPTTWLVVLAAAGIAPAVVFDMGTGEYYFLWFAYVVLSALTGAVVATMWTRRNTGWGLVAASLAVVLGIIGACDMPIDYADRIRRYTAGAPAYATTNQNLTRSLWSGLVWAREHLPEDAVLAVNNQTLSASGDWRYFYYSAFAERRTFLGGWMYSDRTHTVGYNDAALGKVQPFPERLALNTAAFSSGSASAIEALRVRGVTHLLVDKVHGHPVEALDTAATRVFSNSDVDIYAVSAHN
jgi:hypothetical protein